MPPRTCREGGKSALQSKNNIQWLDASFGYTHVTKQVNGRPMSGRSGGGNLHPALTTTCPVETRHG